MNAPENGSEPTRRGHSGAVRLDPSETRLVMITAAVIAFFVYLIRSILLPFLIAGILAYVSTPLLEWLTKRTRLPRALFALSLFAIIVAIAAAGIVFVGPRIVIEVKSTAADLQQMLQNVAQQSLDDRRINVFGQSFSPADIAQALLARIRNWFAATDQLAQIAGYTLAIVMGAFLTAVLLLYFLLSGPRVMRGLFWLVPPHRRSLVNRICQRLDPVLKRYFLGVFAVVIYATIAAYIGLGLILGIHHAVILAFFTGILETVPVLGPTAAAIAAGLVSLRTATGLASILAYALYATILRLSIDQIVGPIVLGRAAHVHPVLIIFCFLAGGVVLGIPGVIMAVPVALIVKNTLATLYGEDVQ